MASKNIKKYLQSYSEPDEGFLIDFPKEVFEHCLVIPCYDETLDFVRRIEQTFSGRSLVVVLVVNRPSNCERCQNNEYLFQYFQNKQSLCWQNDRLSLYRGSDNENLKWLIVDRDSPPKSIPAKQGVGLARKIGCDLAVRLFQIGVLKSLWIHCTDADTHLPENYFNLPSAEPYVAAIYPFMHIPPGNQQAVHEATTLYEQALQYYVEGLRWAGSPYAFHTIGSTMAYNIEAYCSVRGFPKRAAGEDFYLINKLAKLGTVFKVQHCALSIESRNSQRVPFGTGPAIEKILQLKQAGSSYTYYAPETFIELKNWLDLLPEVGPLLSSSDNPIANLPPHVQLALNEAGINKAFAHMSRQCKTREHQSQALHEWFDAFQTLKFIRRMQEQCYPAQPLTECLHNAPWCKP